jgi:nitrite reductase (NADH) large subunit
MLQSAMENMGLRIHLEKSTTAILGDDMVTGLRFKDGTTLECDMVVISCGIRPNIEIASECGLQVERALVVNDQMQAATTKTCMPWANARSTADAFTAWWRRCGTRVEYSPM